MSRIKAPAGLPELVRTSFIRAKDDGGLTYFPTQLAILLVNRIPFQLRFAPSLANKPRGPPQDPSKSHKPADPFGPPPKELFITDVGPSHSIVLNKFAVTQEHFILITKTFKEQAHILEPEDLDATRACIEAYDNAVDRLDADAAEKDEHQESAANDGLYAFFNCGPHSGASQPHRHLQLVPISRMRDGVEAAETASGRTWSILADTLTTTNGDKAPFVTFAEPIKLAMSSADLHTTYLRLYRKACRAVAAHLRGTFSASTGAEQSHYSEGGDFEEATAEGEALISYNLAMTKNTMVVAPRLEEGGKVLTSEGEAVGGLSLNGTVLAGTALVKNENEWDALRKDSSGLLSVLNGIGIPRTEFSESSTKL